MNRSSGATAATVRRRLFRGDPRPRGPADDDASAVASKIDLQILSQKRERWSFDFVNGAPAAEGCWRWDVVISQPAPVPAAPAAPAAAAAAVAISDEDYDKFDDKYTNCKNLLHN